MSPFGIENLPADALKALRTLPVIAERLQEVASHTRVLGAIEEDVSGIAEVAAGMQALAERMAGLEAQITTMDGRMATIEGAMPELVAVQQHLAKLPDTMYELNVLLTRLATSVETLDANVGALQESIEPVGRLADRLPGGSRR